MNMRNDNSNIEEEPQFKGRDEELERMLSPLRTIEPTLQVKEKWENVIQAATENKANKKKIYHHNIAWILNGVFVILFVSLMILPIKTVTQAGTVVRLTTLQNEETLFANLQNHKWLPSVRILVADPHNKNRLQFFLQSTESSLLSQIVSDLSEIAEVEKIETLPLYLNKKYPAWKFVHNAITQINFELTDTEVQLALNSVPAEKELERQLGVVGRSNSNIQSKSYHFSQPSQGIFIHEVSIK